VVCVTSERIKMEKEKGTRKMGKKNDRR